MSRLIRPDVRARESFLAAMNEFVAEGRAGGRTTVSGDVAEYGDTWHTEAGFAAFIAAVRAEEREPRREGYVPQTTWWWVEGPDDHQEFLGRISVRHRLTEQLRRLGGHIGYEVRRSRRREGHASAMLRAALPLAHGMGIDPALITCDVSNVASRRVIESNGGILEDELDGAFRFWVPTR